MITLAALIVIMKTSHWAIIAAFLIPVANQGLTAVCGHAVDVTTINYLSIASEIFSVTIGSADWLQRHIRNPQDLSNTPSVIQITPQAAPAPLQSVVNPSTGDTSKNLNSANGFQFNVNWTGTDTVSKLPTLSEGMDLKIIVPTAEILILELRDSLGNLVLAGDVDADTLVDKVQRAGLSLKGKANILINAYSKALGWGRYQTDIVIQ